MPDAGVRYLAEFVGTFTLCLVVGCCVGHGASLQAFAATAIALTLTVAVYALAPISGAHLNPAVSLALAVSGYEKLDQAACYAAVQLTAGLIAGPTAWCLTKEYINLGPGEGFSWWEVGLSEVLYTLMLCLVVLNVAGVQRRSPNQFFGISIGFVIIAGGYAVGGISGAAFNPAVAASFMFAGKTFGPNIAWAITYWGFQVIGAALAALLFRALRPHEFSPDAPLDGLVARVVAEFTGTFFLVLTVCLNVLGGSLATPWSAAAALMCFIYAVGDISGGHFNPAVTVAVLASGRGKIEARDAGIFVVVQVVAGIGAAFLAAGIHHGNTFPLKPVGSTKWGPICVSEFVFTAVLCLVVLSVATRERKPLKDLFGLAIATCVTAGGFAIGAVSGGALNPAVALGIETADLMNNGKFYHGLAYSGIQLAGGLAAAGAFRALYPSEYPKSVYI